MPSEVAAQQIIVAEPAQLPQVSEPRYFPTQSDLLEMSLHNFEDHASELLAKHNQMTEPQRAAMVEIARRIVNVSV